MKAVMISIHPNWCELIASGKKTVEVRKTKPKIKTPFKVYIYCTLPPKSEFFWHHDEEGRRTIGEYASELLKLPNGQIVYDYGMRLACEEGEYTQDNFLCRKVIGEFVCDLIDEFTPTDKGISFKRFAALYESGLSVSEICGYLNGKKGYGLHISDLVVYDKPKELSEFHKPCFEIENCLNKNFRSAGKCLDKCFDCGNRITRPPQSWCYVEERRVTR